MFSSILSRNIGRNLGFRGGSLVKNVTFQTPSNSRQIMSRVNWVIHRVKTDTLARAYAYVGVYLVVFVSGIYWTRPIYRFLTGANREPHFLREEDLRQSEEENKDVLQQDYITNEEIFLQSQAMKRLAKAAENNPVSSDGNRTTEGGGGNYIIPKLKAMSPPLGNAPATDDKKKAASYFNIIADVVERVTPAVVCIDLSAYRGGVNRILTSNGSGFIVRDDGLVLTNAHVVANKEKVVVRLHNGEKYNGHVVAIDPETDIALLKIDTKSKLPTISLGNSSDLRAGEWVIAIGSPLALSNTVTAGVVSSVRAATELGLKKGPRTEYIQTDASITFGNSGGPLVNLNGEAIGINTMKVTTGISFAIPSNTINNFFHIALEQEKKGGWKSANSSRRYIGVTMLNVTPDIVMEFKEKDPSFSDITCGILITKITPGSPAYRSGLKNKDIITEINGKKVQSVHHMQKEINNNNKINITVRRRTDTIKLTVVPVDVD